MSKHLKQSPVVQMSTLPEPSASSLITTDFTVSFGQNIPPQQLILLYSPDEWENFILEWAHYQKQIYSQVVRQTGSGDMGIDVAGYTDEHGVFGVWDNFQCKHYANPLSVTDACKEIAKILWYSFNEEYSPPRAYYFMAPKGCGTALSKALSSPQKLKKELKDRWPTCAKAITTTQSIALEGEFANYVDNFDFSIFGQRTSLEIIDEHRNTPFHATRFGGGLPKRPSIPSPPNTHAQTESRYIEQLFEAYSDHKSCSLSTINCLSPWPNLANHLQRQREYFYYAESLRNFARDSVPVGTFEELQGEVHAGVVDVAESSQHKDSLDRVNAVTSAAISMQLTSNPLIQVTKAQDRKGICHQLANEDRLIWKKI
ncbi:ABC-three component system protein [Desulfovibrio litoralis]|uniref:ABC-three component systems C-terminal domain-containing protein n=1 Tax=Desulfovibrio litoralis DSM 11393 TaxID=1121455 RepID=A0A1M7TNX0_9BACT|nr:ABC-three component system protein [Desulfovibrio litoralis]SHN72390.1 hypothetical protein SAMN02745728_02310 [Desulfovibrio litoralis DSM 11393]